MSNINKVKLLLERTSGVPLIILFKFVSSILIRSLMQLPYSRTRGKRGFSEAASSIGEMGRWESKALEDGMKRRRLPAWMGAGASSKQGKPRKNNHGFLIRAL